MEQRRGMGEGALGGPMAVVAEEGQLWPLDSRKAEEEVVLVHNYLVSSGAQHFVYPNRPQF